MYDLLFKTASETMTTIAADPRRGDHMNVRGWVIAEPHVCKTAVMPMRGVAAKDVRDLQR